MTEIILATLVVFFAYFLKSFTGFGPALIMVPFFTLIYDPGTAISTAAFYDFIAGFILLITVRKQIQWRYVFSIFAALAIGAIFGSLLLGTVPDYWIKKFIGLTIFIFALLILVQKNGNSHLKENKSLQRLKYPIGALGGFLGGFIGITGPPIIIYLKMLYEKSFFRTQLIGIFFFGAGWRFVLYQLNDIQFNLEIYAIGLFFIVMVISTWVGTKLHFKVNEKLFNKIVAVLLLIPSINLILSS